MRYNVYVVTAAKFVADLYAELVRGRPLGQAATLARKGLADNPMRTIAYDPVPLQDWPVPVVFERGRGTMLWDTAGRRYIDFLAGIAVCGLGHAHPAVQEALAHQAGRLVSGDQVEGGGHRLQLQADTYLYRLYQKRAELEELIGSRLPTAARPKGPGMK